jgi:hypothetical protein
MIPIGINIVRSMPRTMICRVDGIDYIHAFLSACPRSR